MDYLILVNNKKPINPKYIPDNLRKMPGKFYRKHPIYLDKSTLKQAKKLLKNMTLDLKQNYIIISGYRPYLMEYFLVCDLLKKESFLTKYPLPGFSEHQTGLALDIGIYQNNKFKMLTYHNQKEITWLDNNAYKYGFIVRYPQDKEKITDYTYMPWHLRYVGMKAEIMHKYNLTLEEYKKMFS